MRILITGGAGFIGSNLAVTLRQQIPDAHVVCLDNLYRRGSELNVPRLQAVGIEFVRGDVRDPSTFPKGPFDFLIECSAEPSVQAGLNESPDYLMHTNLVGAYHCLEKARLWQCAVIFLSTSRVYPVERLEAHPWRETDTRFEWLDTGNEGISGRGVSESVEMSGARSLYGFTKYSAELLIAEYRAAFGLKAIVNRCGVVAGPWQFGKVDQGVASLWVLAHHFNRPLSYIGYGGMGKQVRDFLHVDDLARLIVEQVQNFSAWDGWIGNVAGGHANSASLQELTHVCQSVMGKKIEIKPCPANRAADLRIFIGDCSKLHQKTTWRPQKSAEQIVHDLATWVRDNETALTCLR